MRAKWAILLLILLHAAHCCAQVATDSIGDPLPEGALLRLGTLRFRAPGNVAELALSPDEQTVVTIGSELIAWDTASGKQRWRDQAAARQLNLNASYGMRAIAFTPASSRFYTPGRPNEVILWDVVTGKPEKLPLAFGPQIVGLRAIDVAPDARAVAFGSASGAIVVSAQEKEGYAIANNVTGQLENANRDRLRFGGHYSFVRFSPDGKRLALVTSDTPQAIRVLEAATGEELRRIALKAWLVRLAFSPDGERIVTTERDNAVRLYDIDSKKELWSHIVKLTDPNENYTSAVAFSPDGTFVAACATDYVIHLIGAAGGQEIGVLEGHTWYPWALAFTADGKTLYSSGWDRAVRRWDVAARKQLPPPRGVLGTGVFAASPDGTSIAYQDDSGTIHLVDSVSGTQQRVLQSPGDRYDELVFSSNGRLLAGGGNHKDDLQVTVWDAASWNVLHRWQWPKGKDPKSEIESLSFTPDGKRLAAAVFRQSKAYIWDLESDKQTAELEHKSIYGLSFSPDGRTLATAGWDSVVRFWAADTGELQKELDIKTADPGEGDLRMYTVRYAPHGGLLATAHLDGTVRVWRADDLAHRSKFNVSGRFIFGSLDFSPDGLWLATGSMSGQIEIWDPLSALRVREVGQHEGYAYKVAFGRDCRTLLSGGADGVCYRWDLQDPPGQPAADLAHAWEDLADENGRLAFQAMRGLSAAPERAVPLLAEKLRAINITDPASLLTARRAISLLAEIGDPPALELLKELAEKDPQGDLGQLAASVLARARMLDGGAR